MSKLHKRVYIYLGFSRLQLLGIKISLQQYLSAMQWYLFAMLDMHSFWLPDMWSWL